ncbi:DUF3500 domain-containing protein [Rhodococcus jostii]|uniref:Uncharacterized protein n=1 Tax=Rhodococcus jostii TaxID=132919 RepID=A0A1H4IIG3_RHOJO|nr:DUF3500 domain-containing protein [Rhodococcus jostii]SEB33780.1 Protein of unknown function [Rhodococcus jostii]
MRAAYRRIPNTRGERSPAEKQLLLDVISKWVGPADEETTSQTLAEIEATIDETYNNWSGATEYDMTRGDGTYFQTSGPHVYVEIASQQGSAGADIEGVTTSSWGPVRMPQRAGSTVA